MQQGNRNCWESLFIHSYQQHGILIEEQRVNDPTPQDDTPRSLSTPSSVLIIPAYRKHQHKVSPSHIIQFNLSDHILLTLRSL